MQRNFDRRIEVAVPLRDPEHREAIWGILETMLADNRQAWELGPDGVYTQRSPGEKPEQGSHKTFLDKSRETGIRLETGTFPGDTITARANCRVEISKVKGDARPGTTFDL